MGQKGTVENVPSVYRKPIPPIGRRDSAWRTRRITPSGTPSKTSSKKNAFDVLPGKGVDQLLRSSPSLMTNNSTVSGSSL